METRCIKIMLKPDSLARVREWAATINSRMDEALATLRDEGVVIESVFLDSASDGEFLIYYMKAESFEKATEVVQKSVHALDEYHQKFMRETCVEGHKLELLVDLDRITEQG